jgi:hypothetical protein
LLLHVERKEKMETRAKTDSFFYNYYGIVNTKKFFFPLVKLGFDLRACVCKADALPLCSGDFGDGGLTNCLP